MKADGSLDKRVIASISEAVYSASSEGWARMKEIFENPGLAMVSFTITEKGYNLETPQGDYLPYVKEDMNMDPTEGIPQGTMGQVAALLLHRFKTIGKPITLSSFDNFSHNGEKLHESLLEMAKAWQANGKVDADFIAYLEDQAQVSTPLSVIDRITPRPSPEVADMLTEQGLESFELIKTEAGGFLHHSSMLKRRSIL